MPAVYSVRKHDRENRRAARRAEKEARREQRKAAKVEQTQFLWPDAPADVAGVARVLSNGGPLQ